MSIAQWERLLAGLLVLAAVVCGVIGLVAGFDDRELELGVTGWFAAATAVGVLAGVVLSDAYFEFRRKQRQP